MIPNFIGGAVPRADKGDRDYYCMAMMTIFKPWRSPADLKDAESTWDQIFTEHDFTDMQHKLIKNFNLRYECNDARDDHYSTVRKKMAQAAYGHFMPGVNRFLGTKDDFLDDVDGVEFRDEDLASEHQVSIGKKTPVLDEFQGRDKTSSTKFKMVKKI
jgi:hypothetical protein